MKTSERTFLVVINEDRTLEIVKNSRDTETAWGMYSTEWHALMLQKLFKDFLNDLKPGYYEMTTKTRFPFTFRVKSLRLL
jgi:hypothetical protein